MPPRAANCDGVGFGGLAQSVPPSGVNTSRLVIVGPTGVGKSRLAVALAQRQARIEIVNADSRQVIRGLYVATATPTPAQRTAVPHHLFEIREPGADFSVADWLENAELVLKEIDARQGTAVVVGGTGLYIDAFLDGLDPLPKPHLGKRIARTEQAETAAGRDFLVAELLGRDPQAATLVDVRNPRRVIRALEIIEQTGRPLSDSWTRRGVGEELPPHTVVIGLDVDRTLHTTMLTAQVNAMFHEGRLRHEVDRALESGVASSTLETCGIGYREVLAFEAGELTLEGAISATLRRTLRYAKAQRTYFRRDRRIVWLDASQALERLVADVATRAGWN